MTFDQAAQVIGILGGVIAIGTVLIGVLVFALRKKRSEDESAQATRVLALANEELEILRNRAGRVPDLESQVKVLREEVGAAKAIAELGAKIEGGFTSLARLLEAHEERARRADGWQQARGDALVEAQNSLLAHFHLPPPRVTPPNSEHRR